MDSPKHFVQMFFFILHTIQIDIKQAITKARQWLEKMSK